MRLLLVEDAPDLLRAITEGLERSGFVVDACENGEDALALAESQPYVGIVLDRTLPDSDGLDVCRALRTRGSNTPILVLTARDALEDRVEGLDAGADDYLVKPFAFSELLARLRAITRRQTSTRTNVLRAGDVALDLISGQVTHGEDEIVLSSKERLVLTALLRHPGRVFTYAQLVEQVWNMDAEPSSAVIRAHIKNLRRKLAEHGAHGLIETVHGLGYRVVG